MSTAIATTPNVEDLIAKLRTSLDALGNGHDTRSQNERDAYRRAYDGRQRVISGLRNVPADIARLDAQVAAAEAQRAEVLAKGAELHEQLDAAPDWRSVRDARERDREYDRQLHLRHQIALLRAGDLLRAPGVTWPWLGYLDAQLSELTKKRDALRATLDQLIACATALIAEPAKK